MATHQINPVPSVILKKSDLEDESLSLLNQVLANFSQVLNNLIGVNGPIRLGNHLDLGGNRVTNVGDAISPTDAVSHIFASSQYGPAAIAPQLESLSKNVMQTYRRLSDKNQREKYSSFLNALVSTAPSSNTSIVTYDSGSGSATITAGHHLRVDGSAVPYTSRTDTLSAPHTYAITSLSRSGNIVTAVTAATGLVVGEGFSVSGASDATFDGTFVVSTIISPTSFTYYQGGIIATSTGGTVSVGGVYYYTLTEGQNNLGLVTGSGSVDTTNARISASRDGTVIIAVVVINGGGIDVLNSAAGASPQQAGSNVAVIRRL